MIDFVATIQVESQRFGSLLAADLRSDVPSCPEWTLADLAWHLTEVQYFWSNIAGRLLTDPSDTAILERPSDDAELSRLFAEHSAALLDAVTKRSPDDLCWSWDASGGTVAWVQRRQAHEALIHRVDAELAARALHAPIDGAIAADGVDEILTSMLSGVPDWGSFTPDGTTVRVDATDTGHRWHAEMGRFTGTSPSSGTSYDLDALELRAEAIADPTTVIAGAAADLDLWLWGRADVARLHVTGDPTTADRIRTMATESTQ